MKKFVIISILLLLIGFGAFGFSLYHYMDTNGYIDSLGIDFLKQFSSSTETPTEADATAATEGLGSGATGLSEDGIFAAGYEKAAAKVESMTKEELVGQTIIGVCGSFDSAQTDIARYNLGGMLLQSGNLDYLSADEVKENIASLKAKASVAPVIAAQEEGGAVTTVSDHEAFSDYDFDSPRNLYDAGGISAVEEAEDDKAKLLASVGVNLNLAPVVDMAEEYDQVMYTRSISSDADITSAYAEYVVNASQDRGVSTCLKHFPGYGTIPDSYDPVVTDTRSASEIEAKDYLPFKAGIRAGTHFIMVSNVVVQGMDASHTAALSPQIHMNLRSKLGFTGLILTDVLDDEDYSAYADGSKTAVAAILAGNDMILVEDYAAAYADILSAVNNGRIDMEILKQVCTRILAYKYTVGILQ